ncbi:MAG: ImmA/IrrE family metallo-endopeptidase [Nitrospinae bacterium]|nr:ImmA/IrrE family metallo-endopeptidase [Nitrospinota bacterium]
MSDLRKTLGKRIRLARERVGFTQDDLAQRAGLPALQTVSLIEKGEREVKAWELAKLAEVLHTDISEFLASEEPNPMPAILWRETPTTETKAKEAAFLQRCKQYAELEQLCGLSRQHEFPQEEVDPNTIDFQDAEKLAVKSSNMFNLGARPALSLEKTLENRFGVKVWYNDLERDGSAASTIGDFGPAILMNRTEAPWRRNYNFAHEVFHLLTWESIPAERLQSEPELKHRIEKIANAFASHLLLPGDTLTVAFKEHVKGGFINYSDIIELAREFDVSTEALLYRLGKLRLVDRDDVESVLEDETFRESDRATMHGHWREPPPMPERYVRLAFMAYKRGNLSRAKLTKYLNTSLFDLTDTLLEYGLDDREDYEAEVRTA